LNAFQSLWIENSSQPESIFMSSSSAKKTIDVACAIIERDGLVLAAQRSEAMSLPLKWEFPGGKLNQSESAADCLAREIREELDIGISILAPLPASDWQYPAFHVTLFPFVCRISTGHLSPTEHKTICWLPPEDLITIDWAEADVPVLKNYIAYLNENNG
jgi:8-oxo-dGTP diphosphatase